MAALGIDYDVDLAVSPQMREKVMKAAAKPKEKSKTTIESLEADLSSDEADETFDPTSIDVDSEDDFEDYEYDSGHTDDDDGIVEQKLENAIKFARTISEKAKAAVDNKTITKKSAKLVAPEEKPKLKSVKEEKSLKTIKKGKSVEHKVVVEKKKKSLNTEKKIKLAASAVTASEAADIVKVVKGKEILTRSKRIEAKKQSKK